MNFEILLLSAKLMNSDSIVLSEITQRKMNDYCFSYLETLNEHIEYRRKCIRGKKSHCWGRERKSEKADVCIDIIIVQYMHLWK